MFVLVLNPLEFSNDLRLHYPTIQVLQQISMDFENRNFGNHDDGLES